MNNSIVNKFKICIDNLKTDSTPIIVFIGGLPGSGKTNVIEKVKIDFKEKDFAVIEADLYRQFLKNKSDVESTVIESNKIEYELLKYSIKNKKNIISISTLRSYDFIDKLINNKLIPNGYKIYFYVILTNEIESIISCYERYIDDKKYQHRFSRLNRYNYFKLANDGFFSALKFFSKKNYFENIKFLIRGNNIPVEIPFKDSDIETFIESEFNKQRNQMNIEKIKCRVHSIKNNLNTDDENFEFNLIYENIIKDYMN